MCELLSNPVDWLDSGGVFPESVNELDFLNYITEQAVSSRKRSAVHASVDERFMDGFQ